MTNLLFMGAVRRLVIKHGSLRAAARVLDCDAGYLSRIARGEKTPSDKILRKLGLRKVTSYEVI